jgi:hypothetical protein
MLMSFNCFLKRPLTEYFNKTARPPLITLPLPGMMQAIGRSGAEGGEQRHLGQTVKLQLQRQRGGGMFSHSREKPS